MKEIQLLDSQTIDKIAAGEVVEGPASIIKELLENSIDAGSTAVTIEIKEGGTSYIRVTDNGEGIPNSQVKKAFFRHATSKIKSIEDLISVSSLGFRGEALSSISSVSKVELLTKYKDEIIGTRYVIEGGREQVFDDAGVPDGTTIVVRDLFFNTPARRKFLKSPKAEATAVIELIEQMMLSNTDVSIKLIVNGSTKLQSSGNGQLLDVIYSIYGRDISTNLIPVDSDNGDIHIFGFVGKPELSRGNRSFEIYFVNNRLIKSSLVSKGLEEAYRPFLMLHKYPVAFLYFEMPGFMIDVNVHPAKREIRFLEGEMLYSFLQECVREALTRKELVPEVKPQKEINNYTYPKAISKNEIMPEPFELKIDNVREDEAYLVSNHNNTKVEDVLSDTLVNTGLSNKKIEINVLPVENITERGEQLTLFNDEFLSKEALNRHRIIGQLFDTYWLIEYDEKLYIVDQHAAHEKIKYERLIKQIRENDVSCQMLNPPVIISLSVHEEQLVNKYLNNFNESGFTIEHFGGHEYAISAVPLELYNESPKDYFHEMLDELSEGRNIKETDSVNLKIATMACKSAVKGNMKMSVAEADELISELLTLENPYNCPHGRPTIVSYSKYDIEKMFKRIVT